MPKNTQNQPLKKTDYEKRTDKLTKVSSVFSFG